MAVLEAMERGLAPIVSDGPGNPEAVDDAGIVVSYGDVVGLSTALGRLAGDPAERSRLGAAARARVVDHFSVARFAAETRAVYQEILRG
jgi:glycosyltransferase involved in cell wall biosynthesis